MTGFLSPVRRSPTEASTARLIAMSALLSGLAFLLPLSAPALAQELELFEDVERTVSSANNQRGNRAGGADAPAVSSTEPEFTLVGASRIGDQHRVVLNHRSGETLTVPLEADGETSIPGHEQFRIVSSESGRVSIRYPDGSNCVEAANAGVRCDAGANIARLSLSPAPLPEQFIVDLDQEEELAEQDPDLAAEAKEAAEDLARDPNNPFARLRAEALGQDVPSEPRFRPRRIDPAQVPPGMRVVSTPFGDRLVEID